MWFLKGRPTKINVRALVESVANGYQKTSYRFSIEAQEDTTKESKVFIAIAFPWAPHKPEGSLQIVDNSLLNTLEGSENVTTLTREDIEICSRLRALKQETDIELVHVQEIIQWYLDDIGVMTFWATIGQTYQLNYRHKIASDSCLFLPTRLPTIIASAHKPEMDYKMWVVNGLPVDLQKHLRKVDYDPSLRTHTQQRLDCYEFDDWSWEEDTRIHTENWESSDDELDSDEE